MKLSHTDIIAFLALACYSVSAFHSISPPSRRGTFIPCNAKKLNSFSFRSPVSLSSSSDALSETVTNNGYVDLLEEVDAIYDSIDLNQDGSISNEELLRHLIETMGYSEDSAKSLFQVLDIDANGEISREEMKFAFSNYGAVALYLALGLGGGEETSTMYSQRIKEITKRNSAADPDSSNKLFLNDLSDLIFDMIDTDQSGEITTQELREHFEKVTTVGGEHADIARAKEYVETIFQVLDLNADGVIEREEMRDAFQQYDFRMLYSTLGLSVYTKRSIV